MNLINGPENEAVNACLTRIEALVDAAATSQDISELKKALSLPIVNVGHVTSSIPSGPVEQITGIEAPSTPWQRLKIYSELKRFFGLGSGP